MNAPADTISSTEDAPIQGPAAPAVIEIPAYKLDRFNSKVAVANRRLEKAGSDARFEFTFEEFLGRKRIGGVQNDEGIWVIEGTWVDVPWIRATQASELRLTLGDYTFLAALVAEEAGVTVHTAPGIDLGGYEPKGDDSCDHCQVNRDRVRLYLVRDDRTGEIIQLGHSCIELFTGFSPKGLFALQFDEELRGLGSDDEAGGYGPRDYHSNVDQVIALAWAYSDHGRDYVSTKIDWKVSTAQHVRSHIFGGYPIRRNFPADYQGTAAFEKACAAYEAAVINSAAFLADADLLAAVKASVASVDESSDYGRNLRVILAGESVSARNLGILASLVAVYARAVSLELKRETEAKRPKAQGFLAPVGTRIKTSIELEVTVLRTREGDYGWSTWIVGITPDGYTVSWNASNRRGFDKWVATGEGVEDGSWVELEAGDKLVLSAATVKAHENYQGTDQTVITRAKLAQGWG